MRDVPYARVRTHVARVFIIMCNPQQNNIMKKYFILSAVAALALASCTSDDVVANGSKDTDAIRFASATDALTRATHTGADAAKLLKNNFVVMGTKGGTKGTPASVVQTVVYDNYNVNWTSNTAGTTASNTADWEYVGQTPTSFATTNGILAQTVKYWDYSQGQYDFIAYSLGTGSATATAITPATATSAPHGGAYTLKGDVDDLSKCYIADLVTVENANFGKEVQIAFRSLGSKVRVALYEKVPGYSIKDVEFYESDAATAGTEITKAQLYSSVASIVKEATYTVYFPTVNTTQSSTPGYQASDVNKAHVAVAATDAKSVLALGAALDYNNAKSIVDTDDNGSKDEVKYLGESLPTATYVGSTTDKTYYTVLPNENASALTLRCNYTLVSDDGSEEEIKVWGAKAVVPAEYCQWKSNYAYTYIFKITDKTNGQTEGLGLGQEGLIPITFDAVVVDSEEFTQSTITTVETPSITTYQKGHDVTKEEYAAGTENIYVMVQDGATLLNDLDTKGQLYTVDVTDIKDYTSLSEATVMDALNMGTTAGDVTTGRNGIKLTKATSTPTTTIPAVNGNDIVVGANQCVKFAATAATYAYVYTVNDADDTTYNTAVVPAASTDLTGYFEDFECTVAASGTADGTTVYYQKLTNNNTVYAVKVITVQ